MRRRLEAAAAGNREYYPLRRSAENNLDENDRRGALSASPSIAQVRPVNVDPIEEEKKEEPVVAQDAAGPFNVHFDSKVKRPSLDSFAQYMNRSLTDNS